MAKVYTLEGDILPLDGHDGNVFFRKMIDS